MRGGSASLHSGLLPEVWVLKVLFQTDQTVPLVWPLKDNVLTRGFIFQVCGERRRFEKLMEYFHHEDNNIDFMVNT